MDGEVPLFGPAFSSFRAFCGLGFPKGIYEGFNGFQGFRMV